MRKIYSSEGIVRPEISQKAEYEVEEKKVEVEAEGLLEKEQQKQDYPSLQEAKHVAQYYPISPGHPNYKASLNMVSHPRSDLKTCQQTSHPLLHQAR